MYRVLTFSLPALLLLPTVALAVPLTVAHQGEVEDASGPVTATLEFTFALYDAATGGNNVWSETRDVDIVDGDYSILLGTDTAIDSVLFAEPALYLQITVEGGDPLLPRQELAAAPYAVVADTAVNVDGGTVNASSITVNGSAVIDSGGNWAGAANSIPWSAVDGVPADEDTLAGLSCADQSLARWDDSGSQWVCATDLVLTSSQVLAMINGATVDLGAGSQMGGVGIATADDLTWGSLDGIPAGFADGIDDDTDTVLTGGQVLDFVDGAVVDLGAGSQLDGVGIATADDLAWGSLDGIPAGFADGIDDDTDTVLTEGEVLDFVDGAVVDLGPGSQMDGVDLATVNDVGGGITQADVYVVQGTFDSACVAPDRVSKAYCSDSNDVLLGGWCAHIGHIGGTSHNIAQGPLDSTSSTCPTTNEFQNYAPTTGGAFGPGPLGWACRESSASSALPAYALCLSVD